MKKNGVVVTKAAKKASNCARRNLASGMRISSAVCNAVDDILPFAAQGGYRPALAAMLGGTLAGAEEHRRMAQQVRALLADVNLDHAGYLRGHPASPVTKLGL